MIKAFVVATALVLASASAVASEAICIRTERDAG